MKEYFEDDRFIVPDDIKRMTSAERLAEIAKLKTEIEIQKKACTVKSPSAMRPSA